MLRQVVKMVRVDNSQKVEALAMVIQIPEVVDLMEPVGKVMINLPEEEVVRKVVGGACTAQMVVQLIELVEEEEE